MSLPRVEALLFAEHSKLSTENPLLKEKIKSLENLNKLYISSDSLQRIEIIKQNDIIMFNKKEINKLNKQKRVLFGTGIGSSILCFIIGILL